MAKNKDRRKQQSGRMNDNDANQRQNAGNRGGQNQNDRIRENDERSNREMNQTGKKGSHGGNR
ncbi:MAG TPA: hypothetical protein VEB40_07020 [Flavipsychrobacter sp.]|nr:hypothetical protein [Flavipsychrobacter sp.]